MGEGWGVVEDGKPLKARLMGKSDRQGHICRLMRSEAKATEPRDEEYNKWSDDARKIVNQ
jgi:hypothetical protein